MSVFMYVEKLSFEVSELSSRRSYRVWLIIFRAVQMSQCFICSLLPSMKYYFCGLLGVIWCSLTRWRIYVILLDIHFYPKGYNEETQIGEYASQSSFLNKQKAFKYMPRQVIWGALKIRKVSETYIESART